MYMYEYIYSLTEKEKHKHIQTRTHAQAMTWWNRAAEHWRLSTDDAWELWWDALGIHPRCLAFLPLCLLCFCFCLCFVSAAL